MATPSFTPSPPPRSALSQQLSAKVDLFELVTRTMRADWPVFLTGVLFFFSCQFLSRFVMNRMSKKFRSLSNDDKNTWCVRFVAAVNSLVCMIAIPIQLDDGVAFRTAHYDSDTGYASLYQPMPFPQRYFFISLSCYFIYDVIVCVYYRWGAAYTVHGIVSFCGVYSVAWPFAERYASYMGTLFEGTGVWLHGAEMLSALDAPPVIVTTMKAVFSVLFLLIRPIGGTIHAMRFTRQIWIEVVDKGMQDIHHPLAVVIILIVVWAIMALQLYWTKDVLVGVLTTIGVMNGEFGDSKSSTTKATAAANNNNLTAATTTQAVESRNTSSLPSKKEA